MAFEGIASKLQNVFKKLTGRGKLSEKDLKEAMREVKLALLEADVNFNVVKTFIKSVTDRAVGAEVMESLTPGQQVIKIVNDELTALMGGINAKIEFGPSKPAVRSGKDDDVWKACRILEKAVWQISPHGGLRYIPPRGD